MALARPERLITLTLAGDEWAVIRSRMRLLRHRLAEVLEDEFQWAWTVEPNPKGTGHHVHAMQYGGFVPQRVLARAARREGMGGVVDVRRLNDRSAAPAYLVKLASSYGLKLARDDEESLSTFMRVNGGRQMVHASRGFWRDGRGRPLSGVTQARKLSRPGGGDHQWSFYRSLEVSR